MKRSIILFTLLVLMALPLVTSAQGSRTGGEAERTILHDSQLVYSNQIRRDHDFDEIYADYPALATPVEFDLYDETVPAAEVLNYYAEFYSINPLVLLAIMEANSDALTAATDAADLQYAAGYRDGAYEGFAKQMDWLAGTLAEHYYQHRAEQPVPVAAGEGMAPGTFALHGVMTEIAGEAEIDGATVGGKVQRFLAHYRQYQDPAADLWWKRPEEETASTQASQPYMELPWQSGDGFHFTAGPHNNPGYCCQRPWSSLDYAPQGPSGCDWTSSSPIKSARAGTVVESHGALVKVDHQLEAWQEPWSTSYYHLRDRRVWGGSYVNTSTTLGYPSCEGGALNVKVHFAFLRDGQFVEAHGKYLSGWLIESADFGNGTMSKGGTEVWSDPSKQWWNLVTK